MQTALILNGARRECVEYVPHGVPARGIVQFQEHLSGSAVRFAYVGRLNRVKGLHVLVQAFNRLNGNAELHILGKAKTKKEKRYWASVLRLATRSERLIQHGYLDEANYREIVGSCDAVIVPSICLEVFGLTVAEAFSLGRPVITTDCGGPAEQIRNGVDGIVVPPDDVTALAQAMQAFVSDPGKVRSLANNIREPISMEQHIEALLGLYSRCSGRNA
jgi:glycosyltransferase involved in cell wall biosynthesis